MQGRVLEQGGTEVVGDVARVQRQLTMLNNFESTLRRTLVPTIASLFNSDCEDLGLPCRIK